MPRSVPGVFTGYLKRNRAIHKGNGGHVFLGLFHTFAYRFGDFPGFSQAVAYLPVSVTNDNNCTETEPTAALDDLRHPVDMDDLVN